MNQKHCIKGLAGKARQGKDTAGAYLSTKLGIPTYSFAQPIKEYIHALCGWADYRNYEDSKELQQRVIITLDTLECAAIVAERSGLASYVRLRTGSFFLDTVLKSLGLEVGAIAYKTPRELYQLFGTEYGRDLVDPNIWIDLMPRSGAIITDVRFPNEAAAIRASGGQVIHITRDNTTVGNPDHPSEQTLRVFDGDIVIDNSGTLEELYAKLDKLL